MHRFLVFLFIIALMGCDTASPEFRGLPVTRVTVDGSTFDVRVLDERAEAVRVNTEYAPRFGPIRDRAARAMAQVSGCRVMKVKGDQALSFADLQCSSGPRKAVQGDKEFECVPVRGSEVYGIGEVLVDLDCSPY